MSEPTVDVVAEPPRRRGRPPKVAPDQREDEAPAPVEVMPADAVEALSRAHTLIERQRDFIADLAGRLFCLELMCDVRMGPKINFTKGTSLGTYQSIRDEVVKHLTL